VGQADVSPRHERERRQELLAELAVGDPRGPVDVRLEREEVDEDGLAVPELDVVGGRVAERPAGIERLELDVERQQRGVAQLAERPLVRVRDELERFGPQDDPGIGGRGQLLRRLDPWDQPALLDQRRGKPAPDEGPPVLRERLTDLAEEDAVAAVNEPARVTIRAGIAVDGTRVRGRGAAAIERGVSR
jgi:hypothetical protein